MNGKEELSSTMQRDAAERNRTECDWKSSVLHKRASVSTPTAMSADCILEDERQEPTHISEVCGVDPENEHARTYLAIRTYTEQMEIRA